MSNLTGTNPPRRILTTALALALLVGACDIIGDDPTPGPGDVDTIVFTEHIQPILSNRCTSCHGGTIAAAGLELDGWTKLVLGSDHGEAVIPFNAERSALISRITDLSGDPHPGDVGEELLSSDEIGLLRRWIEEGARNNEGVVPYAGSNNLIYVASTDDATISVIDETALVVVRLVDLQDVGFSAQARPYDVAVEPDGSFWYVSLVGEDKVLKFNRDNELVAQVSIQDPGLLALQPGSDQLWVGRAISSVQPPSSIALITRSSMIVTDIPVSFSLPHAMAIGSDRDVVYTASYDVDQLMAIGTGGNHLVTTSPVSGQEKALIQFALRPGTDDMWGTAPGSDQITLFNVSDPAHPEQRQSLFAGSDPWGISFLPNGLKMYAANRGGGTVSVMDASLSSIVRTIGHAALSQPTGIAVSRDGAYIFVAGANGDGGYLARHDYAWRDRVGTVVVISTLTDTVVKVLEVGEGAGWIGSGFVVPVTSE